jgi:hypothetical protein
MTISRREGLRRTYASRSPDKVQRRCGWCMHLHLEGHPYEDKSSPCTTCSRVAPGHDDHLNFEMPPIPFEELK